MTDYANIENSLNFLAPEIHADNVRAGWYTDINTGESIVDTRNRPEMLMLVVSELSEASEGLADDLYDDKLPHRKMFEVELADAAIRVIDQIGLEGGTNGLFVGGVYVRIPTALNLMREASVDAQLMTVVNAVSRAMEHYRKRRIFEYKLALMNVICGIVAVAELHNLDLFGAIAEKRAYNANRADHKIENRRAPGGKQF